METKEYIVALHEGVDYDQFWLDMENVTVGSLHIPDRAIGINNDKNGVDNLCEYLLTDLEAEQLRKDPRVISVEIPIDKNPYITVGRMSQNNYFTKPTSNSSVNNFVNWGLPRHSNYNNPYVNNTNPASYVYALDGTGVDVVISDTGIQWDHPEFQDSNSVNRVKRINWYQLTGVSNQNGVDSYTDYDGHGTHVAGTVAGKTYGWAKNAHIYAIKTLNTQPGDNINSAEAMRAILLWHQRKTNPSDPIYTGRPTVVNMSWGSSLKLITVNNGVVDPTNLLFLLLTTTGGTYKNQNWSKNGAETTFTDRGVLIDDLQNPINELCANSMLNGFPLLSNETDATLNSMINAGIVVCIAAGNSSYKIDNPTSNTSQDFNNYLSRGIDQLSPSGKLYYHRGSSPTKNLNYPNTLNAIKVGNIDSVMSGNIDQPALSSMKGPGVDIWAAGTNIMSSGSSNDTSGRTATYFLNSSFKQLNDTGTSMASPQIAGMCALYLQKYPTATPAEVKNWLLTNATNTILNTGTDIDYTNPRSLLGGAPRVAYQNLQGLTKSYIKDSTNTWREAKAVWVKHSDGTWKQAKSGWQKNDAGTWIKIYEL